MTTRELKRWAKWITSFTSSDTRGMAISGPWLIPDYWCATNGHRLVVTPDQGQVTAMVHRRSIPSSSLIALADTMHPIVCKRDNPRNEPYLCANGSSAALNESRPPDLDPLWKGLYSNFHEYHAMPLTKSELQSIYHTATQVEDWTAQQKIDHPKRPRLGAVRGEVLVGLCRAGDRSLPLVRATLVERDNDAEGIQTKDTRRWVYNGAVTATMPDVFNDGGSGHKVPSAVQYEYLADALTDDSVVYFLGMMDPIVVTNGDGTLHLIMPRRDI